MKPESPFNTLPVVVVILALAIVGIEVVFQLANAGIIGGPRGLGWRLAAIEEFGFAPAVLDRVLVSGDYSLDMLKRFVTYTLINGDLIQMAFCAALVLALGKFTAEYYGSLKVLVVYVVTSIAGAVVFGLLAGDNTLLIGAFTPVYGLIGAYTYVLWLRLGIAGENQIMAFRLIGFLLAIQLIFGLIFGGNSQWISELAGFVTGFVLSTLLAPGGWASLVRRMRERS
ncbi:membrane associated rhomboid family serine protease [Loktanella sp. PT4BL]|jgi:membrane associated rhomboid family serine protease|uniref:rhomboid family intramembrane serine protease n=1 Tax=Loktanella sp. PT4BL TaxID=2135611 RepID=UPI000D754C1B|nr:rhomboid family intramembrane serine protease [Loktanella sp. PT4BL]PXW68764.1 membrane associated rhomboid family serine protease [Loktanella sp. PT4BL]